MSRPETHPRGYEIAGRRRWPLVCLCLRERTTGVNSVSAPETRVIHERFERALRLIRASLAEVDLKIVQEIDLAGTPEHGMARPGASSKILLVDCPLLLFEALALDRAAAVFFPLHVLVSGIGDRTRVSIANPAALWNARLPVGAAHPMQRLVARIELALASASERAHAGHGQ